MKRMVYRIAALGLSLLLCTGAAAQTASDVSTTMAEKLLRQLNMGSGFTGTLTITADAVQGRETNAVSTIMPIVMDLSYIVLPGDSETPDETRLTLLLDASEYQQGDAEFSLQGGNVYMQSSLLADGWYLLDSNDLDPLMVDIGVQDAMPAVSELGETTDLMTGSLSFLAGITGNLLSTNAAGMDALLQGYLTAVDLWLEGYRQTVETTTLEDGTSAMVIAYSLPPDAVKAQLKQLLVDLMNDESFMKTITDVMPDQEVATYLDPELQPYYFYAIDELPLDENLAIRRVMSLKGETLQLEITMPLYDSVSGAATLSYTRTQGGEDMPSENELRLESQSDYLELNYRSYVTITGTQVYQGTLLSRSMNEDGIAAPAYWAAFDISMQTQTTKDLQGYETLYQTVKLSVAPAAIPDGADASEYVVFTKTDFALDMKFSSLATKTSPTNADITLTMSGDDMAQTVTLALSGATTAKWTPDAFEVSQATVLSQIPEDELQALMSQAVIKGGLLFLPYLNLPQVLPAQGE